MKREQRLCQHCLKTVALRCDEVHIASLMLVQYFYVLHIFSFFYFQLCIFVASLITFEEFVTVICVNEILNFIFKFRFQYALFIFII